MIPETRYAQSSGYSIAYQMLGQGPDLVLIPGFVSNVEMVWEIPAAARFLERLASFSRLIIFDKRGTGLSDRVPVDRLPSLEERIDDLRAVMEAVGSERPTLFGVSEGGPMAVLFAATDPDRVERLILYGSYSRREEAAGSGDRMDAFTARIERDWGTGAVFADRSRSVADDPSLRHLLARYERHSASPQAAAAIVRMGFEIDVSPILAATDVPTLVLHRVDDPNITIRGGLALAEGIAGARLVQLPGEDHVPFFGDIEPLLAEVEEFVTGTRSEAGRDRILATVLFVDIVDSTVKAAGLGDSRWGDLLEAFYASVRASITAQGGEEMSTAGDGMLAQFPSPTRAVRCALEIRDAVARFGLEVRVGLHTGEVERRGEDVAGIAVHLGARIAAAAQPGEVWVSRTVRDLVAGSSLRFESRGEHELKGFSDLWGLYAVLG
jgi:class 3 adenylate cyclase/pimeloyl-ACP methyl ester carboxylesterase